MKKSRIKKVKRKVRQNNTDQSKILLNTIDRGKFATVLLIFSCFLALVAYDYEEAAIYQSLSGDSQDNLASEYNLTAAKISEFVSILFVIGIFIYTENSFTKLRLEETNQSSIAIADPIDSSQSSTTNGLRIVAFFDLLRLFSNIGTAIGTAVILEALESL